MWIKQLSGGVGNFLVIAVGHFMVDENKVPGQDTKKEILRAKNTTMASYRNFPLIWFCLPALTGRSRKGVAFCNYAKSRETRSRDH